jgi:hypothetical protein
MPSTFEIFPAIGIARVGTSDEFFVGPEPNSIDLGRRDINGDLKRQAARFRIYECNRDGAGTLLNAQEVTAANVQITWSVHLVNRKAAANRFNDGNGGAGRRNNATGNDATDTQLIIDGGMQSIKSPTERINLDKGKFKNIPVSLGRLELQGTRLCVIGGKGMSQSPSGAKIGNFADNDDWHDDVSDGPVTAQVTRAGQTVAAQPAWVIVAPPDFAPEITNVVTMYDVLEDLAVQRGLISQPPTIFFDRHIQPILERAMGMQWVNRQARLGYDQTLSGGHAAGGPGDFSQMPDLADPTKPNQARQKIFNRLRDPVTGSVPSPVPSSHMPRLNDDHDSGKVMFLTRSQHMAFKLWSQGDFQTAGPPGTELEPDALTRVALEACAGGAFFPGIEAGRIMRRADQFMANEVFRLNHSVVRAGDITAENALPWQADFHLCRWEPQRELGWWPAQRPDDVLKQIDQDPVQWTRGLKDTAESMVKHWHRLGFVKRSAQDSTTFLEEDRDPQLSENGAV